MADHFMIDLETMSTAGDAAILSIGIQPFDPREQGIDEAAGAVIHVDLQACMNAGLRVEAATVMWWMTQADDARAALVARDPVLLSEALRELTAFGQKNGGWSWAQVWGNGAAFDIPILENAFRRCRLDIPWAYNKVLDVRTMKWLAPDVPKVMPRVAHDALSDAQAQALYVQDCHRALRGGTGWTPPVYADMSMDAQASRTALEQMWTELGVRNQTEAMEKLREMGAASREEDRPQPPAAAPSTVTENVEDGKMDPLTELWYQLQSQDWWHMMSDDPRVDRRGHQRLTEARAAADRLGDEGKAMFKAWEDHVKRGGPEVPLPQKS
jgi:hypothetical protein